MSVAACILVVLAGGFLSVALLRHHLRVAGEIRLDPLGLRWFPKESQRPPGRLVISFGDSRAAHWPPFSELASISQINRGIAGQTTAQILGRLEPHVLSLHPDVVVLQAGSNDLKTVSLFPEITEEIVENCIGNLRAITESITASGGTVVLTTVFPHGKIPLQRRPFFDRRVAEATRRVNDGIRTMAGPKVIIMDCDTILAETDGFIRPEYSRDLLHLTPAGYAALNKKLAPILSDILKREP